MAGALLAVKIIFEIKLFNNTVLVNVTNSFDAFLRFNLANKILGFFLTYRMRLRNEFSISKRTHVFEKSQ